MTSTRPLVLAIAAICTTVEAGAHSAASNHSQPNGARAVPEIRQARRIAKTPAEKKALTSVAEQ